MAKRAVMNGTGSTSSTASCMTRNVEPKRNAAPASAASARRVEGAAMAARRYGPRSPNVRSGAGDTPGDLRLFAQGARNQGEP